MPAIKYKKKTYAGATFPVLEMTKAEYDALPDAKKMDGTVYMITDDDGGWEAERSTYDNTASGLTATNVQSALDEISSKTTLTVATSSASSPQTIPSGSAADFSINVAKSGKKAIAVIGLYPDYPATISVRWFILLYDTQTVECRLWNHYGNELTTNITITCLYVAND